MLRLLKNLRKREWLMFAFSCIFIFTQVWLELKLPDYMADITRLVQTPGSVMSDVLLAGGKMLLCAFGSLISAIIVGFLAAQVSAALSMRLRSGLFEKVQSFSMREINRFSTASLITRSTNDITQIQMIVVMGMQVVLKAPVMAVMAILKIIDKGNAQWSALTGGAVLALLTVVAIVVSYALPKFRRMQTLTDNLNRVTRENLTGLKVVRAYNAEEYAQGKFEKANTDLTTNALKAQRAMAVLMPTMTVVMSGISLGIYWIGAFLIDAASMPEKMELFSNMVVFSSYAMQVIMSFVMMTMIFIMLPRAQVSAKRIQEVLQTETTVRDGSRTDSPADCQGTVEFRHVNFRYPDAESDILHDINFKVEKGQTIAFIGSTGSGKSTIVNLAARFYDATEGEILVDGVNVKDYTLHALHNKFGYVPQRTVLFSGTIRSNVAYGESDRPAATDEEVQEAVEIAQGKEFVEGLEDTYNGFVAQGGANFSGGQKQRISIARAICRKPEIYIFDDSFSALDYKTDKQLRAALKKRTAGVTSMIVAQRIGTIRDADIIAVVDEGRIVGMGTHQELMKSCEVYQQIAYSQLSKEELE